MNNQDDPVLVAIQEAQGKIPAKKPRQKKNHPVAIRIYDPEEYDTDKKHKDTVFPFSVLDIL